MCVVERSSNSYCTPHTMKRNQRKKVLPKKGGIKRLAIYDLQFLAETGRIEGELFRRALDEADGLDTLISWREGVEELLSDYDRRWIIMCSGDMMELTEWAARIKFIRRLLDEIDRNLAAVKVRPRLFNKDAVGSAWGMVNAFRVAAEQMLDHNEA